jgi:N-methylhydantoinase A/oxoprolinase/acetone carboxylase beta subunit
MSLRLGIDTGGTFTDAVLVDDKKQIINAEKSLTTRFDLSLGIGDVIARLPQQALADISMVSLSTTLTTNSVVEDLGAPVCVLLPGYTSEQVRQSGLLDILPAQMVVILEGGYDAVGREHRPLDEEGARAAIEKLRDEVSAFAISSMFGTRNSSHENRLKQLVTEITGMPVICGHELASSLGAPRRALTAALNARMVPAIKELINSVQTILERHNIEAPLMLVKGDGSLAGLANAIEKPIGTVLSGPAASVIGACQLSGLDNAIIADMGGTTTDIAIVSNGQPELSEDGASAVIASFVSAATWGLRSDRGAWCQPACWRICFRRWCRVWKHSLRAWSTRAVIASSCASKITRHYSTSSGRSSSRPGNCSPINRSNSRPSSSKTVTSRAHWRG